MDLWVERFDREAMERIFYPTPSPQGDGAGE